MQPRTRDTHLQQDIIDRAAAVLGADQRIEAVWLEGSFAGGTARASSDVDLHVAVDDSNVEAVAADARRLLGGFASVLGAIPAQLGPVHLFAATIGGPARVDLYVEPRSIVAAFHRPIQPRVLLDRAGLADSFTVAPPAVTDEQAAQRVRYLIEGYLFGFMWPARLAERGEWSLMLYNATQVISLFLVPAMLLQTEPEKALRPPMHFERFLSPEQQDRVDAIVRTLTAAYHPTGPELVDGKQLAFGHQLLIQNVLNELHLAAIKHGVEWPFEAMDAVKAYYWDELGIEIS